MRKQGNQKGFSLVELVVVMAILSILGIAAYGFFSTSSRAYGNTGAEVDLQYEAQMVQNQLDNLIIDTTKSLDYYYGDSEANRKNILSDAEIVDEGTVEYKGFHVKNEDAEYLIEWSRSKKKVTLKTYVKDEHGNLTLDGEPDGDLLAEYVSKFSVDLRKTASKRIVKFSFEFANSDKNYLANHNVTMRNRVPVNGTVEEEYPDAQGYAMKVKLYYKDKDGNEHECTNGTIILDKKDTEQSVEIRAEVIGKNNPRQKVQWSLVDTNAIASLSNTTDTTCTLKFVKNADKSVIICAKAVDLKDKIVPKASAEAEVRFGNIKVPKTFVRGSETLLQITDTALLSKAKTIKWGFLTIQGYQDYGYGNISTPNQTEKQSRRIVKDKDGNRVVTNSVWNDKDTVLASKDNIEKELTEKNNDGYYTFKESHWRNAETDDELFFVLDEADPRLSFGQCYLKAGKDYRENYTLGEQHGYQVAVRAKLYDENGKEIGQQTFGSTTIDQNNDLYMDPMRIDIYDDKGGMCFSSSTGSGGRSFSATKGEDFKLNIVGNGWYQKPYIKEIHFASGDISCMEEQDSSKWYDEETGELQLKFRKDYQGDANIGFNWYLGDRQLYWIYVSVPYG